MKFVQVSNVNNSNSYQYFVVIGSDIISRKHGAYSYSGSKAFLKLEGELHV